MEVLLAAGVGEGGELAELLWTEMGLSEDAHITQVPVPLIPMKSTIHSAQMHSTEKRFTILVILCCYRAQDYYIPSHIRNPLGVQIQGPLTAQMSLEPLQI